MGRGQHVRFWWRSCCIIRCVGTWLSGIFSQFWEFAGCISTFCGIMWLVLVTSSVWIASLFIIYIYLCCRLVAQTNLWMIGCFLVQFVFFFKVFPVYFLELWALYKNDFVIWCLLHLWSVGLMLYSILGVFIGWFNWLLYIIGCRFVNMLNRFDSDKLKQNKYVTCLMVL